MIGKRRPAERPDMADMIKKTSFMAGINKETKLIGSYKKTKTSKNKHCIITCNFSLLTLITWANEGKICN